VTTPTTQDRDLDDPEPDLDELLEEIARDARPAAARGDVADYIPPLREADPESFGFAVVEVDGTEHVTGDVDEPFPIQSVSKVFSLVLAMQRIEADGGVSEELWSRVGREPSGDPFNSLVQLEHEQGKPRNPMINAGALIVDDLLLDHCSDAKASTIELLSHLARERFMVDADPLFSPTDDLKFLLPHNCTLATVMK
jgi:glutaminase